MFYHDSKDSVEILKSSLDNFSQLSGLNISHSKSSPYLSGIDAKLQNTLKD